MNYPASLRGGTTKQSSKTMSIDKKKLLKQEAKDLTLIILGLILYAAGWTGFLLPSEITTGGVTGVAALIFYATKIPIGISYFSINTVLLLLSIKIFGFKFSLRTVLSVFILTGLLTYLQAVIQKPLVEGELFMNAVLGGVVCGLGIGLVFTGKGSTGGTDIIALIINKYRNVSVGKGILFCDLLIISSSYMIFHSVEKIVYGIVVMGVMSYTIDAVLNSSRQSVQFFIFSEKFEEIADMINQQVHRGCTILNGTGWYTKNEIKVVVVMVRKSEAVTVFRLVKLIDSQAFISQSNVVGVFGRGFEQIKG